MTQKNMIIVSHKHLSSSSPLAYASVIYTSDRLSALYSGGSPAAYTHETPPDSTTESTGLNPGQKLHADPDNYRIIA